MGASSLYVASETSNAGPKIKRVIANEVGREVRATASRYSVAVSSDTLSFGATFLLVDTLSPEEVPVAALAAAPKMSSDAVVSASSVVVAAAVATAVATAVASSSLSR